MENQGQDEINCLAFNNDHSYVVVGTKRSFLIDSCQVQGFLATKVNVEIAGGISIVQMLEQSNIVAFVGTGSEKDFPKNKIVVWDLEKNQKAAELVFPADVLDLRLRRDCLVAVLERKVYVYDLATLRQYTCFDSFDNPLGLCAISQNPACMVVVMPSHNDGNKPWLSVYTFTDKVSSQAFKWGNLERKALSTHSEPFAALALNNRGSLLAVGSEKGTNVKIYATSNCQLLHKVSRGNTHCNIIQLEFNKTSSLLSLTSSDKSTIHVWRLDDLDIENQNDEEVKVQEVSGARRLLRKMKNKIKGNDHMMWQVVPLADKKGNKICGFSQDEQGLLVATQDGRFF